MKDSTYHSLLRIAALTLAVVLLFDSGLLLPVTRNISQNTQDYLAQSIGMYAGVQPTELNQMTAELTNRSRILTQRENEIVAREIAVDLEEKSEVLNYSTYIMSVLLFILLALIILNYAMDYTRRRQQIFIDTHEKVA